MGKKKPPRGPVAPPQTALSEKPTERAATSRHQEEVELSLAMQGVVPLDKKKAGRVGVTTARVDSRTEKVAPFGSSAEDEARARLAALVAGDVRFRVEADVSYVRGARIEAPARVVRELARRTRAAATLDLHGMNARTAREEVVSFLRKAERRGLDVVRIIHGKGQHSEGGQGVLREVVLLALTESGAAPVVHAFVTAPESLGGNGALLVELHRA